MHDLHPDYASTRYARAATPGASRRLAVQHHHAHMASCMAENGLDEPVIGVTFDGTGLRHRRRDLGRRVPRRRLPRLPPGGPPALRRHARRRAGDPRALADGGGLPGRRGAATSQLLASGVPPTALRRGRADDRAAVQRAADLQRGPAVRAVAALAGVRDRVSYEGRRRSSWNGWRRRSPPDGRLSVRVRSRRGRGSTRLWSIDTRPLIAAVAADVRRGVDAAVDRPAVPFDAGRDRSPRSAAGCGGRPGSTRWS